MKQAQRVREAWEGLVRILHAFSRHEAREVWSLPAEAIPAWMVSYASNSVGFGGFSSGSRFSI
jgi:hypothetical protein